MSNDTKKVAALMAIVMFAFVLGSCQAEKSTRTETPQMAGIKL